MADQMWMWKFLEKQERNPEAWNTEKMEDARMGERTNVIKLRYARNGEPAGREYTFYTPEPVEVGDEVVIDVISQDRCSYGVITAVNVPLAEIEPFGSRAKTIVGKAPKKEQEATEDCTGAAEKQLLDV